MCYSVFPSSSAHITFPKSSYFDAIEKLLNNSMTQPKDDSYSQNVVDNELKMVIKSVGFEKEDVDVTIEDRKLMIKSNKTISDDERDFVKHIDLTFTIPEVWDIDSIRAELKAGLLYISFDKAVNKAKKQVKVV